MFPLAFVFMPTPCPPYTTTNRDLLILNLAIKFHTLPLLNLELYTHLNNRIFFSAKTITITKTETFEDMLKCGKCCYCKWKGLKYTSSFLEGLIWAPCFVLLNWQVCLCTLKEATKLITVLNTYNSFKPVVRLSLRPSAKFILWARKKPP